MIDYQQQLEARISNAALSSKFELTFKPVFGARAAYANGRIFATCGKFGFALKLPEDVCSELISDGLASPLKYFEKGHVKRNYAVMNEDHAEMEPRLRDLIVQSARFVQEEQ
jgi:TfoX N-terminal domain